MTGVGYCSSYWYDCSPFCSITRTSGNCYWEWFGSIIDSCRLASMNYMDNHPVTCILNFVTAVLIASHQCCITIELKFIRNQFHRETLFLVILQTLLVWPRLGLLKHGDLSNVECFLYSSYLLAFFQLLSESFLGLLLSTCCFLLCLGTARTW